jgi:hypothetical protein
LTPVEGADHDARDIPQSGFSILMERDTLEEILAVEKDLRARLDAAKDDASRWLAGVRRDVERQKLAELARLDDAAGKHEVAAQEMARATAAAIVRRATEAAQRIEQLTDDELARRVRQHVASIVPTGDPA